MDLVIKNAIIAGEEGKPAVDIGIDGGLIVAIGDNLVGTTQIDAGRKLVSPGLVESHIHLDKSNIFEQSRLKDGSIDELFLDVIRQKRDEFSTEDIRRRAITTLEKAIRSGVTHMRTQLEVDPYVGLRGLEAVMPLIDEYKWAIDLEICVFPEEPLFDLEGTEALMIEALDRGCRVVGGLPSGDRDSKGQIDWVFERAKDYGIDIDMHLDANENPEDILVGYVCDQAEAHGYQGRVTVAHLNKETAIPEKRLLEIGRRMAGAGVAATVLPTTDLYLGGRHMEYNIVRGVLPVQKLLPLGVNASLATNNLNNGITPNMRCSPLYQANSFALSAQVWKPDDFDECFEMITRRAAKILRRTDYGIKVGNPADLVVLDCQSRREAVCAIAPVLYSFKAGQMITRGHQAEFFKPTGSTADR